MTAPQTLKIDDVEYVRKDSVSDTASSIDGMPYCIVRTYSAGVFAGYIQSRNGHEVIIRNARRLWYWSGAASLSQLALEGTKKPNDCKFPAEVSCIEVLQAIEIITVTKTAQESIASVKIWKQ
jgi:hypothetical protein